MACGCNKNNHGQQNARGRTSLTPARTNRNFVSSNNVVGMNAEQRKKQALRRDLIRKAKGI